MNAKIAFSALAIAAAFAGTASAETPDVSGQFANAAAGQVTRADVQAELAAYKKAGVNPWSTWYNPLKSFQSTTTRQAVVAEYLASRNEVKALNGEDSGSAWLAEARGRNVPTSTYAGTPVNAQ
jgi:hypothetical protein